MAAAVAGAGVSGVLGAVVDDVEVGGLQRGEPVLDGGNGAYGKTFLKGLTVIPAKTPAAI